MTGEQLGSLPLHYYSRTFDVIAWTDHDDDSDEPYIVRASFTTFDDATYYVEREPREGIITIRPPQEWVRAVCGYLSAAVRP